MLHYDVQKSFCSRRPAGPAGREVPATGVQWNSTSDGVKSSSTASTSAGGRVFASFIRRLMPGAWRAAGPGAVEIRRSCSGFYATRPYLISSPVLTRCKTENYAGQARSEKTKTVLSCRGATTH